MSNKISRRQMLGIGAATIAGVALSKSRHTQQITAAREQITGHSEDITRNGEVIGPTGRKAIAEDQSTLNRCRRFFREKVTNPSSFQTAQRCLSRSSMESKFFI